MATIRLIEVSKSYQGEPPVRRGANAPADGDEEAARHHLGLALDRVTLTAPHGQTMAIVGPSGCGKSTLLRVVAGLEREYSGQVRYDEQPMEEIAPGDRHIGMVFQNYALYPHFAGRGNLSFFFRLRKVSDQETEERIRITAEIMGLGFKQLLERKPGTLSGGQQQRLAIGRAIVRNPRLFLFDEPLSNLDAKLRQQTRIEIKRLLARFSITALYVTHDQTEAMALGDQVAVMRQGRIEQVGRFQEVLRRPVNTFVASFLGSPPMNLLPCGEVHAGMIQLPGLQIALPAPLREKLARDQQIIVGVRPEGIQVLPHQRDAANQLFLRGQADVVEPDFGRSMQLVYAHNEAFTFTATAPIDYPIYAGHPVTAQLDLTQLHFFDGVTHRRLDE